MRRSIFYQPLAVFMAVLMLPPFSWVLGAGRESPMAAKAQIDLSGCEPNSQRIIQNLGGFCDDTWAPTAYVQQLENDSVSSWLQAHQMPPSDRSIIYQIGRSSLRSELRAYMLTKLMGAIESTTRTDAEKALYLGLQKKVQQYDIQLYTAARDEFKRWMADPCHWAMDPNIAKQYDLKYDAAPFCVTGQAPANYAPSYDYFVAYGMLNSSYGKAISDHVDGPTVQAETGISLGIAAGAIAVPTAAVAGLLTFAVLTKYLVQIFPYAVKEGISTAGKGPAGVAAVLVFLAVVGGIIAGFQIFSGPSNTENLSKLNNKIAEAEANLPDLTAYIKTKEGRYKIHAAFVAQTLREFSSTQPMPVSSDTGRVFIITSAGNTSASTSLSYKDLDATRWTASLNGAWMAQNGFTKARFGAGGVETAPSVPVSNYSPTIAYTGLDLKPYSASMVGDSFLVTKLDPALDDKPCSADPVTGVTTNVLTTCLSWVTSTIQILDYEKNGDVVSTGDSQTVSLGRLPEFTSGASASWLLGTQDTFQVKATGSPAASITQTGALPAGITFTPGNPATLSGATSTDGVYPMTFTATSSVGSVKQNFTLTVGNTPKITSPNIAVFTAGRAGSFTVTSTGKPAATLALGYAPPTGLSFASNGDGTATISGTPEIPFRNPTPLQCFAVGCGIQAINDLGSTFQAFSVVVNPAPLTIDSWPSGVEFTMASPSDGRSCPTGGSKTTPVTLNLYKEDGCVLTFPSSLGSGPGMREVFSTWEFGAGNPRTIGAPSAPGTYTAYYQKQYYLITSAGTGGSVSPGSTWVVPQFGPVGSITITATPSTGYAFTGFTGSITGTTNPQIVTMDEPKSVKANFGLMTATAIAGVSGSYSKPVNLTATVSAVNGALNPAVAGTLQFSVNNVNVGSPIVVNGGRTYSVPYTITQGQGSYTVRATFTGATAAILGNSTTGTLTVTPNAVTLAPAATNPTTSQVVTSSGTSSFQLTASFQLPAPLPGANLSQEAPVTVTLDPLLGTTQITCPGSATLASGVLTATGTCSNVPVDVYQAKLTVGGPYFSGSSESVVSVFDPSQGSVTGGGTLTANGVKGTFAVSGKYNKSGQPEGDVSYIAHKGVEMKLKSDSLQSFSVVGNTAVFLGKATVDKVGNYSFRATAISDPAGDLFGLQVTDSSGKVVPDLSFSPMPISGNVRLPK
jgi:hypothetical protein